MNLQDAERIAKNQGLVLGKSAASIIRAVERCGGNCPCVHGDEPAKRCPCDDVSEIGKTRDRCTCGLFQKGSERV